MNSEICKKIGKLLKEADRLHLHYYEVNNKLSKDINIPELIGSSSLIEVLRNPIKGIKFLRKKANPFLNFCQALENKYSKEKEESPERRLSDTSKLRKNSFYSMFNQVMNEISSSSDEVDRENACKGHVDPSSQNIIMLQYLS